MSEHKTCGHGRRTFLRAVGVGGTGVLVGGALASCGQSEPAAESGTELGKASDVPVSSAALIADAEVLVSQPTKGEFKAFSAVCTHQGCLLNEVDDDVAVCPCHHSKFSVTDGSVVNGPATEPLEPRKIHVEGDTLGLG